MDKVWMKPPFGAGEPAEVDATPEVLVPLMVAGYTQCTAPERQTEVIENVHD
jgi:hypothetical protein